MLLQLNEEQVRDYLPLDALVPAMEDALSAFSSGGVDQPVRAVVDVDDGRGYFAAMPAHLRTGDALGAKLVTVFGANLERGLPSHMATILLFDTQTGALIAMMDGRYITEVRTAAVSAVSVLKLARPDASKVAILGSGVQARSHVELLRTVLPSLTFRAYSPNRTNLAAFSAEWDVEAADCARSAIETADIVVLATSSPGPVFEAQWIRRGAHVVSVGACRPKQREMDPVLLNEARIFVDSRAAALRESGDILMGGFEGRIVGELGELLIGVIEGRRDSDEITVFKSLGLAVEDVACAKLVYERAVKAGLAGGQ